MNTKLESLDTVRERERERESLSLPKITKKNKSFNLTR